MNTWNPNFESVRDDFVPASDYFSKDFAELENERLWPRAWQMACREEDIPHVGDYYTYDIVDDSITIIRTKPDEIKAFHNACAHRGRRLTAGCGHTTRFHCRFHGWQFDLDGKPVVVVDQEDWGDKLKTEDISLIAVKVGRWGGFVFINMDPNSESLEEALLPAKAFLDPFDYAGLRYFCKKSTIVPCNWKVALEAFNEGYHLQQTHKQLLKYTDDYTTSRTYGRHGMFGYWDAPGLFGMRSPRLGPPEDIDLRQSLVDYVKLMHAQLPGMDFYLLVEAAERLVRDLPASTPPLEVLAKFQQFGAELVESRGVRAPSPSPEQLSAAGADWHIFPNMVFLMGTYSLFVYRARPNGHDPNSAVWDVISLLRYPPGQEPKVEQEWSDDLADEAFWGKILLQDFANFADVQRGLKSRGFRGSRTNPKQESAVSNFHRALHEFVGP